MTVRALAGLRSSTASCSVVGVACWRTLRGWRSWHELVRPSRVSRTCSVSRSCRHRALDRARPRRAVLVRRRSCSRACCSRWPRRRFAGPSRAGVPRCHPERRARGRARRRRVRRPGRRVPRSAVPRGRLAGLSAWDAWAFWVPKAKAIYFFGGLDEQFFRELANPTLSAARPGSRGSAFHFMGSADVVTLHVQFWFFACGFVAAVAGLLAPRVPRCLLWPVPPARARRSARRRPEPRPAGRLPPRLLLRARGAPRRALARRAGAWQLATASVFLGAALLTKREGQLLVACIVLAAACRLVAQIGGMPGRASLSPRPCAIAAGDPVAYLVLVPRPHGRASRGGLARALRQLDRGWPAFESVVPTLFDYDLWLVVAAARRSRASCSRSSRGARVLPAYTLTLYALAIAGFTWVLWSFTELELPFVQDEGVNPIVRLSGSLVVRLGCARPAAARRGVARYRTHHSEERVKSRRSVARRRSGWRSSTRSSSLATGQPAVSVARRVRAPGDRGRRDRRGLRLLRFESRRSRSAIGRSRSASREPS